MEKKLPLTARPHLRCDQEWVQVAGQRCPQVPLLQRGTQLPLSVGHGAAVPRASSVKRSNFLSVWAPGALKS